MKDASIFINAVNGMCSIGNNSVEIEQNLFTPDTQGLQLSEKFSPGNELPLGLVSAALPDIAPAIENTRNNRLLAATIAPLLEQINTYKERYGSSRIATIVGTSTSGISDGESAIAHYIETGKLSEGYDYAMQEISAPARFLAKYLGVKGPSWAVSSACTSGGKALVSASRLLRTGACDVVIVAGVDTLCGMTVAGFSSLGVTSKEFCKPFSQDRQGINIGEGAAVFIVSRDKAATCLLASGESSDAYHISAPDPEGLGAEKAMRIALKNADISADQVDYINFHGTATTQNDKMEALACARVFPLDVACGSTKALTGHTLGAAGALEALFCIMCLQRDDGLLPVRGRYGPQDPELPVLSGLAKLQLAQPMQIAMSNSFAFGGNNLSLLFARVK